MTIPDIEIAGLKMWIHGRQFPESDDYWDGNWLDITAGCTGESAFVEVRGPILHLSELKALMEECRQVYNSLSGEAHLECMEPNLRFEIRMENSGLGVLEVFITPDPLRQEHYFTFEIDQSFLPSLMRNLEDVLHAYPLKSSLN